MGYRIWAYLNMPLFPKMPVHFILLSSVENTSACIIHITIKTWWCQTFYFFFSNLLGIKLYLILMQNWVWCFLYRKIFKLLFQFSSKGYRHFCLSLSYSLGWLSCILARICQYQVARTAPVAQQFSAAFRLLRLQV